MHTRICIATPLLINLLAGTSTPCREIQSTVTVETRIEHDANAINGSSEGVNILPGLFKLVVESDTSYAALK